MTTFNKYQRGFSFWEISLYILIFGFVLTCLLTLGPRYIDDQNVSSAIRSVHESMAGKDVYEIGNKAIRDRLSKHFQVSMIDESILDNLEIEKDAGHIWLRLNYEARIPFMGNVDVLIRFEHEVDLAGSVEK